MLDPRDQINPAELIKLSRLTRYCIPFFATYVPAGFPSPAENYLERTCDVADLCTPNIDDNYLMRMPNPSLLDEQIDEGDWLIIDKGRTPTDGRIVVARLEGDYVARQIRYVSEMVVLLPAHPAYEPIYIHEGDNFEVFGVVTFVIQPLGPASRSWTPTSDQPPEAAGDLNRRCIAQQETTYFARVSGDSMAGDRIDDGDILIVDSSVEVANQQIVMVWLNNDQMVKRIRYRGKRAELHPSNPKYSLVRVQPADRLLIFGVVTFVIKKK